MSLNTTPSANRLHIGIFGKRNSGKSSLINAITNQETALVSDVLGTTTDPVLKAMEIKPIGPCILIDTAGFDDLGELGKMRIEATKKALLKTQIALLVIDVVDILNENIYLELKWIDEFNALKIPYIIVINKIETVDNNYNLIIDTTKKLFITGDMDNIILVSTKEKTNINAVKDEIVKILPEDFGEVTIVSNMVSKNDIVMLIMPQDEQAPKGRLILPQVQTIRELLDNKCIVVSTTESTIQETLNALKLPPKLIITDSQCFKKSYDLKPEKSLLTSFSVLFAAYKGDIEEFVKGVAIMDKLNGNSNILIAEACTHAALNEDIGRVKIPNMLKKRYSDNINITVVSGNDFPKDISKYDLVIHCGACMFNRKHVLNRIKIVKEQGIPITNYGIVIAYLTGILDKIALPNK